MNKKKIPLRGRNLYGHSFKEEGGELLLTLSKVNYIIHHFWLQCFLKENVLESGQKHMGLPRSISHYNVHCILRVL